MSDNEVSQLSILAVAAVALVQARSPQEVEHALTTGSSSLLQGIDGLLVSYLPGVVEDAAESAAASNLVFMRSIVVQGQGQPHGTLNVSGAGSFPDDVQCALEILVNQAVMAFERARDLADRAALEMELRHSQKLEAIGRLASGVAHEINTPIQFVGSNLHFLKTAFADYETLLNAYRVALPVRDESIHELEDDLDVEFLNEQIPQAVEQGLDGAGRVSRIVKAMKVFGHPDGAEQIAVDVNDLVTSTITVARNEWKYVATTDVQLGEMPLVLCFPGDINQVVLNLIVNAAHAIGDKVAGTADLGVITVTTAIDGGDVLISVGDNGTGISDEVRSRIFDPFFTTKEVGLGTGQGLALVKTVIVDRHGGKVELHTEVGVGSTFTLRIPSAGIPAAAVVEH